MTEIRGRKPTIVSKRHVDPIKSIRITLADHYTRKRKLHGVDFPNLYDQHLYKLFSDAPEHAKNPSASGFLRRNRAELRRMVAYWTGEYQYTIDQVLHEMIDRCRELDLRLDQPVEKARRDALVLITVQTMYYLQCGRHRVVL
jgi:hypothetical protein